MARGGRLPRPRRHHPAVDPCDQSADPARRRRGDGLRDLSCWAAIREARQAGTDRLAAYYIMYRSTAHVIIGSGLTVAAAIFCLRFTRTPYFQSLGIPAGLGSWSFWWWR